MQVSATPTGLSTVHPSIKKLVDSLTLATNDQQSRIKNLKSLHTLSKNEKNRQQVVLAGALPILIGLCHSDELIIAENALRCLHALAEGEDNVNQIGTLGMDTFLTNLSATHSDVVINTCKLLVKLTSLGSNRAFLMSAGVPDLVDCLKREHEWIRLYATKALMMIVSSSDPRHPDVIMLQQALQAHSVEQVYNHYRAHIETTNPSMDL